MKYIFGFIICILFRITIKAFKYFKAFNLLSNDLIFITDEGIIKYNIESNEQKLIESFSIIQKGMDLEYISFAQFSLNEGGYILCRIKDYIYIFSKNADILYGSFIISEIKEKYIELIPYQTLDYKNTIIISYLNIGMKICLLMYEINFLSINESRLISQEIINQIKYSNITLQNNQYKCLDCKIMESSNQQQLFTCFAYSLSNYIDILAFDQENNFTISYELKSNISVEGIEFIVTDDSSNQNKNLICYLGSQNYYKCLIYYSNLKRIVELNKFLDSCTTYQNNKGIKYIYEQNEFIIYCYQSHSELILTKIDENYNLIKINSENKDYLKFIIEECYGIYSSSLIYDKIQNEYYIFTTCSFKNEDVFKKLKIYNISSEQNYDTNIINTITSLETLITSDSLYSSLITQMEFQEKCDALNFFLNLCKINSNNINDIDNMSEKIKKSLINGTFDDLILNVIEKN